MTVQNKYQPLQEYLRRLGQPELTLTIGEIEQLLGSQLPPSAHSQRAWWSNRRKGALQAKAWMDVGYWVELIDLAQAQVTFRRRPRVYQVEQHNNIVRWDATLVKALRHHMGLTQTEFAQELGVRQPTVSEWETGAYDPRRASSKLLTLVAEQVGFPYVVRQEGLSSEQEQATK